MKPIKEVDVIENDNDDGMAEISEVDSDKKGEVPNGTEPSYFNKNVNIFGSLKCKLCE